MGTETIQCASTKASSGHPPGSEIRRSKGSFSRESQDLILQTLSCQTILPSFIMVKEIADHSKRSAVTMNEVIIKVENLLREDKSLEKTLHLVRKDLKKGKKENTLFPMPDHHLT